MGALSRVRQKPRAVVAIAAGAVLVLAWIGWAIYVTSEKGTTEGVGVLIAWPALLVAAVLIAVPFVGAFFLLRRLSSDRNRESATDPEPGDGEASADSDGTEAEPTRAG